VAMKNMAILCFLLSFNSFAGVAIISDLDDTIKITHVADPKAAFARGIFGRNTFIGMPEFLKEARTYSEELHILTASPPIIYKSILSTLSSNGIKYDSVAYKNPFKFEGKIPYKVRKIQEVMDKSPHQFILLGDDVDIDPEIFEEVKKLYPDRILASYIHVVRGREIPEGSIPYWTAADLALRELQAERMSLASAEAVLDSIYDLDYYRGVIPDFADCPKSSEPWEWYELTPLAEKATKLKEMFVFHCNTQEYDD
jgi:phosphatidate phosphatase APP1